MRSSLWVAIAGTLVLLGTGRPATGQRTPGQPQFTAETDAVLVDVVVSDPQRRFVRGLTSADFELFENGERQEIVSCVEVAPPAPEGRASDNARAAPVQPGAVGLTRRPSLVALVIEQLGPQARALTEHAAATFLDGLGPLDFVAVFAMDRALHAVQPYTNDRERLRTAVRTALMRAGQPINQHSSVATAEFGDGGASQSTLDENPYIRGRASLDALQRVVRSLSAFPHRKAMLLFSEGLALDRSQEQSLLPGRTTRGNDDSWLTDGRRDQMTQLLAEANRAQVAIYTVDAAGLRTGRVPIEFGRAPYVGLQLLAEETGGVFVQNTNDFRPAVQALVSNLGQYYELGYVPKRAGKVNEFNAISVKVSRPNVSVLARRGYAGRTSNSTALKSFEVLPWLLLNQPTLPRAVRLDAGAIHVPEVSRPGRVAVLARVETAQPALAASTDITILVHIKSSDGKVVRAASERFGVAASSSTPFLLFLREPDLTPGVYTMEAVAYDAVSQHAGARVLTLDLRYTPQPALTLSDVFVVHTLLPKPAGHTGGLILANHLVVPNLDRQVPRGKPVVFGFIGQATGPGLPSATVALRQQGVLMDQFAPDLPRPLPDGRVAFLGTLPNSESLAAGTYQLDVTFKQASHSIARSTVIRIAAPAP